MGGLLRKLTIWICIPIYRLIVSLYSIFYNIANTHFLKDDTIQQLSANIYVLVSVVMLFAFSITILSAIVNPDLLNDSKKGVAAAFKRAIIGLALMVVIPFIFDEIYDVQENIMDNSLIEKIIVGADFRCDQDEDGNCKVGGNGGQVIAGNLISAVLYPDVKDGETVQISENISEKYEKMITTNIEYISAVAKHINVSNEGGNSLHSDFNDEDYAFNWDGLVAIIAGGATCYILLLFAIDMAIRVFKLAFLELTAPISIVAYMAKGDEILKSWFSQTMKTFLDVFVRIAAIAFYLFLIKNLSTYMAKFEGAEWSFTLKVLLIVGMLIFVKQIPDLINNIFKTSISLKGGIGGRLGEMAVVGEQAKKAWGVVSKGITTAAATTVGLGAGVATLGATGVALGAAGVGLAHHAWNKGFKFKGNEIARAGKDTKVGQRLSKLGHGFGTGLSYAGSYLSGGDPYNGYKNVKKKFSESDYGKHHEYEVNLANEDKLKDKVKNLFKEALPANVVFKANNDLDTAATLAPNAGTSSYEAMIRNKKIKISDASKDALVDYNKKENDLMLANQKSTTANNLSQYISDSIAASSNDSEKKALLSFKNQIENNNYNSSNLSTDLSGVDSSVQRTVKSYIDELKDGSGMLNMRQIEADKTSAQEKFDKSSDKVSKAVDNASSDTEKQIIKQAKSYSKSMNKHNTGTL